MSEAVPSTTMVSVPLEAAVGCAAGAAARTVRVLPVRASVRIRAMAARPVQKRRMAPEYAVDSLTSDLLPIVDSLTSDLLPIVDSLTSDLLPINKLNECRCARAARSG